MKESYKVRPSQSPWPRVMRVVGQPGARSVHRGTTGLCIELRKQLFCGGRPCPLKGKAIVISGSNGESEMIPTESETTSTVGNFSHGSQEIPSTSVSFMETDRSEKARCHKSDMHVAGKSDSPIVPEKPANNGGVPPPAELAEGRGLTEENVWQLLLDRTLSRNANGRPFVPRSRGLPGIHEAVWRDLIPMRCFHVNIQGKSRMR